MTSRRVHAYVAVMCVAAIVCLWLADWSSLTALPTESRYALAGLIAIALFSETLAIGLSVGGGSSSITFLPLLAGVQLFGPVAGMVLIVPTMVFADAFVRRKDFIKVVFNAAQLVVGTTAAGSMFRLFKGEALYGVEVLDITTQFIPFMVFGFTFLAANHAAVSLAITLSQGLPFRRVWGKVLSNSGGRLNDILVAPLALAVAFLYVQFGIPGIVVISFPMLFIRYSYITTSKLRESNADLLTALVKAIETRDPYTSGHSLRVSKLAQQIAEHMGLQRTTVEHVRQAALLHDIGKIEAVYTDILRKPDSLTAEERLVIESHVTKGEQLLRDLSSVPEAVVLAVRHHHEREDGKGYPDQLLGDEIPMGAKIIVVCDSVDAMLSDRPYRKALSFPVVLDQLEQHSGQQFDHRVVMALVSSGILAEYAATMRVHRDEVLTTAIEDSAPVIPLHAVPSLVAATTPRSRKTPLAQR